MSRWLALVLALVALPLATAADASVGAVGGFASAEDDSVAQWEDNDGRSGSAPAFDLAEWLDRESLDQPARHKSARPSAARAGFRTSLFLGAALQRSPEADAIARLRRADLPYDATPPPARSAGSFSRV